MVVVMTKLINDQYLAVIAHLDGDKANLSTRREALAKQLHQLEQQEQATDNLIEQLTHRTKLSFGPYIGMGILEATCLLLTERNTPMLTDEITDVILAGGVQSKATQPKSTVYGILHRDDSNKGLIEHTDTNKWGLRKWTSSAEHEAIHAQAEHELASDE